MICSKCGKILSDELYYCDQCGTPTGKDTGWASFQNVADSPYGSSQNPYQNQNQNPYNNYSNSGTYSGFGQYKSVILPQEIEKIIDDSRLFGVLSIILGLFISSIIGIILGAIGLSRLNEIPYEFQNACFERKEKAKKLNIIGIVLPLCLRLLFWILYIGLFFGLMSTIE